MGTARGKFSRDKDTCSGAGVPEGAPSLLRWRRCNQLVHLCHSCSQPILSHSTMAWHRHGIWLDHVTLIPPHARVSPSGTEVTMNPGPAGLIPDQTRYIPALGVQEHRLTQDVSREALSQQQPGSKSPLSVWRPLGPGTLPCTSAPFGTRPTLSTSQGRATLMGAQGERAVPRFRHSIGTRDLLPLQYQEG